MFGHMDMPLFHGFGMFVFWFIIIFILYKIFNKNNDQKESAIDILKKRYAKGEITKEQFEEMKKTLL